MTEQATILVLVSPELIEQMTAGKWSAPVQITIDPLDVPGPSGETHLMTARSHPQPVDDGSAARLAEEALQRGVDEYYRLHPEPPARLAGDQLPYGGPA